MPTINQLIRSPRSKQLKRNKVPALEKLSTKKEVFVLVFTQLHQKNLIQL